MSDNESVPISDGKARVALGWGAGICLWTLLMAGGCAESNAPPPPDAASRFRSPGSKAARTVALKVIDEGQLSEALTRHRGKVLLVDFWATWCPSCVELFPHTVQLHRAFSDKGLVVVTVSFDDPDSQPHVTETLQAKEAAGLENYLSRYGASADSTRAFAIENDTLPTLRLYDRRGTLRQTFGGGQQVDPGQIERAVAELL
jgi:thiol-disulfide isomerase/thioredoxin